MNWHRLAALAALLALTTALPPAVLADEFPEISKLYKQGKRNDALDRLEKFLVSNPRDSRARFLKGVILTEQNKNQEAIDVFTALSVDFPELPEPYNNLAVLYAGQGDYEKARELLEMAIRTHPSYAVAHENLGDVYATLASQAYDKALQLDKGNTTARAKLALIRELFPVKSAAAPATKPEAPKPAEAPAAVKPPEAPIPPGAVPTAPAAPSKPPAPPQPAQAHKPVEPPMPAAAAISPVDETKAVLKMVEDWASAWSNNDAEGYLAFYAPDFTPPKGEPRAQWEAERRDRLAKPRKIQVSVVQPRVTLVDAKTARVSFRQNYSADSLKTTGRKTLVLTKQGERWLIRQELVGK
jgi:Flp pilus assembly protein TadD/ketosteroid isomerase-like protein